MINNFQLLKQFDEQMSSHELTTLQKSAMLQKYVDLLLSQLQVGDSIEGLITKLSDNKYTLQVKPQIHIPIDMFEQLETGKLMTFIVQGKEEGKLYLQSSKATGNQETPLAQKVLEELNLPKNVPMKEIVDDFLKKHLPLVKETLLKAYQLHKTYEIPSEVVTNLIEHQETSLEQKVKTLSALREEGLNHLVSDLKSILQGLGNKEDLIKVFSTLKEQMPDEKINTMITKVLDHKELNEQDTQNTKVTQSRPSLEETQLKLLNVIESKDYTSVSENVLKKLIGLIYDEMIKVNIKNIKSDQGESEKVYNTYNTLTKILKTLDKADLSKGEMDYIQYIKEPLSILGKANVQAEYFMFPMLSENSETQGELYFFKPKKTHKKNQDNFYIVLSLTLPSIDHIQIHINKQEKNVLLHIEVEDEIIQKHITEYMPRLNEQIETLGFSLSKITWGLLDHTQNKQFIAEDAFKYSLNHMDFKI